MQGCRKDLGVGPAIDVRQTSFSYNAIIAPRSTLISVI